MSVGVLMWITLGPIVHIAILPEVFRSIPRTLPAGGWVPEPFTSLGIGLALVGTLGAFIGTRPWPETNEAYRLSHSVLLVLFLLSAGTACIAVDASIGRFSGSGFDLLTPALVLGATFITVYFANSQTVLWGDLRRLHLERQVNALGRMHADLWRTFTNDDVSPKMPTRGWQSSSAALCGWGVAPALALTWAVWRQDWPAGTSVVIVLALVAADLLVVLAIRLFIGQTASTPRSGLVPLRAATVLGSTYLISMIALLEVLLATKMDFLAGTVWMTVSIGHSVSLWLIATLAIADIKFAMSMLGTYHLSVERNASARQRFKEESARLQRELTAAQKRASAPQTKVVGTPSG